MASLDNEVSKCVICPGCNQPYSFVQDQRFTKFPLLLSCGHNLCDNCVKKSVQIVGGVNTVKCRICKYVTNTDVSFDNDIGLQVDVYIAGLLRTKKLLTTKESDDVIFIPTGEVTKGLYSIARPVQELCEECRCHARELLCIQCHLGFCNACFVKIHSHSRTLRMHKFNRISADAPMPVPNSPFCAVHVDKTIIMHCMICNMGVCWECINTRHAGHQMKTLHVMNSGMSPSMKKVLQNVKEQLSDHFVLLHGQLQVLELEFYNQLEDHLVMNQEYNTNGVASTFEETGSCTHVSSDRELINITLRKASEALSACQEMPCCLIPKDITETPVLVDEQLDFSDDITFVRSDVHTSHGSNSVDLQSFNSGSEHIDNLSERSHLQSGTPKSRLSSLSVGDYRVVDGFASEHNSRNSASGYVDTAVEETTESSLQFDNQQVVVTCVKDPSNFFIRRTCDLNKCETIVTTLSAIAKKLKKPTTIIEGNLYAVRYKADKMWYRARVEEILYKECATFDRYKVLFIDYGNTEEIASPSSFLILPDDILANCPLALCCTLWDLVPRRGKRVWPDETIKFFKKIVTRSAMAVSIVQKMGKMYEVDLFKPAYRDVAYDMPSSVRDILLFMDMASYLNNIWRKSDNVYPASDSGTDIFPHKALTVGQRIMGLVSEIVSPVSFYLQLVNHFTKIYQDMMQKMQVVYKKCDEIKSKWIILAPKIGMLCSAKYSVDSKYYRARVIDLPGNAQVQVRYIDYGNSEILPWYHIRVLHDQFFKLTEQAVACCLYNVELKEGDWNAGAITLFEQTVHCRSVNILVKEKLPDNKFAVMMEQKLHTGEFLSINKLIADSTCGEPETISTSTPRSTVLVSIDDELSVGADSVSVQDADNMIEPDMHTSYTGNLHDNTCTSSNNLHDNTAFNDDSAFTTSFNGNPFEFLTQTESIVLKPAGEEMNDLDSHLIPVRISFIESPEGIYVQKLSGYKELRRMQFQLQRYYNQAIPEKEFKYEVGNICVAFYSKEKQWYRARVTHKADDGKIQVHLYDYGFKDELSASTLRSIDKKFSASEAYALRCNIDGIIPSGDKGEWGASATNLLQTEVEIHDKFFILEKGSAVYHPDLKESVYPIDIIMKDLRNGELVDVSFCEMLRERGYALYLRTNRHPLSKRKSADLGNMLLESLEAVQSQDPSQPGFLSQTSTSSSQKSSPEKIHDFVFEPITFEEYDNEKLRSPPMPKPSATIEPVPECVESNLEEEFPESEEMTVLFGQLQDLSTAHPELEDWLPAESWDKTEFVGRPTYVDFECQIYVQDPKNAIVNKFLCDTLYEKYGRTRATDEDKSVSVGSPCIAKYHLDNKWYRSRVIKCTEDDVMEVVFVDWGNVEVVNARHLRKNLYCTHIPLQVNTCQLQGVRSTLKKGNWLHGVLDTIHEEIVDKPGVITVHNKIEDIYQISLVMNTGISLYDFMVNHEFSLPIDPNFTTPQLSLTKEQMEESIVLCCDPLLVPDTEFVFPIGYFRLISHKEIMFHILPSRDENKSEFQQEVEKFSAAFSEMDVTLQSTAESLPMIKEPIKDVLCCSQYALDGRWYRAVIQVVKEDCDPVEVNVRYVDYGNIETIPLERIRMIPEDLLKIPQQAVYARLHGLTPGDGEWTNKHIRAIKMSLSEDIPYYAIVKTHQPVLTIDIVTDVEKCTLAYQDCIDDGILVYNSQ